MRVARTGDAGPRARVDHRVDHDARRRARACARCAAPGPPARARERHSAWRALGLTAALLSWVVVLARERRYQSQVAASEAETDAERDAESASPDS